MVTSVDVYKEIRRHFTAMWLKYILAFTRKRVHIFLHRHLIHHLILYELIADIFLYRLLVLTHRVYIVATASEVPAAIFILEVCMTVEYH